MGSLCSEKRAKFGVTMNFSYCAIVESGWFAASKAWPRYRGRLIADQVAGPSSKLSPRRNSATASRAFRSARGDQPQHIVNVGLNRSKQSVHRFFSLRPQRKRIRRSKANRSLHEPAYIATHADYPNVPISLDYSFD
jgi:hypothetical protein